MEELIHNTDGTLVLKREKTYKDFCQGDHVLYKSNLGNKTDGLCGHVVSDYNPHRSYNGSYTIEFCVTGEAMPRQAERLTLLDESKCQVK